MLRIHIAWLSFLAMVLLATASAQAANLVSNGNFETWSGSPLQADGWGTTVGGQDATYVQSSTAHGGSFAALVTPTTSYAGIRQQNIAVLPNTAYKLSAWMIGGNTGNNDVVRIMAVDGGTFNVSDTNSQGGLVDGQYKLYTLSFKTQAATTSIEIQFGAYQDPSTNPISFYIDDVSLDVASPLGNGNFETWSGNPLQADGWVTTVGGQDATYVQSTTAHGGSYAALVSPTDAYGGIRQQNIPVQPNTTYTISAWMKDGTVAGGDIVRLLVVDYAASGTNFDVGATNSQGGLSGTQYSLFTLTFTTHADTTSIEVQFGSYQSAAFNFYIDDVSLDVASPLNNGDFEAWSGSPLQATGWVNTSAGQDATYVQSTTAHGGSFAALVSPTDAYGGIRQQNIPVQPNTTYYLSAWMKDGTAGGGDIVRLMAVDYGSGGPYFDYNATNTQGGLSGTQYNLYTVSFTTHADTTSIEIQFGSLQSSAFSFYIDDVTLQTTAPTPTPTPAPTSTPTPTPTPTPAPTLTPTPTPTPLLPYPF